MDGLEEILIPVIISGIVFYSVFVEMRNQAKLRAEKASKPIPPKQKEEVPQPIIIEEIEKLFHEVEKKQTDLKPQLKGDETKPSVKPVKDAAYDRDEAGEIIDITEDMRRAVIAHEILKRKF